ncbi:response regulator transcription factor [Spirosoma gilvum]
MSAVRLLLFDPHPIGLAGLSRLLNSYDFIDVVATASTTKQALAHTRLFYPEVVLFNIHGADQQAVGFCNYLTTSFPEIRAIILSSQLNKQCIFGFIQAGAVGYLYHNASVCDLIKVIQSATNEKKLFCKCVENELLNGLTSPSVIPPLLTTREKEILCYLAQGLTSLQIAQHLFISHLTIETHRRNLLVKFGATNVAMLIKQAVLFGFV